jgi:hypothetical protein
VVRSLKDRIKIVAVDTERGISSQSPARNRAPTLVMRHVSLLDTVSLQDGQNISSSLAALSSRWNYRGPALKPTVDATAAAIAYGLGRAARWLQQQQQQGEETDEGPRIDTGTAGPTTALEPPPPPSSKVFLAAPLESCALCDVGPGASTSLPTCMPSCLCASAIPSPDPILYPF